MGINFEGTSLRCIICGALSPLRVIERKSKHAGSEQVYICHDHYTIGIAELNKKRRERGE